MQSNDLTRRNFGLASLTAMAALGSGLAPRTSHAATSKLNFQSIWLNDPEFLGYMIAIDKSFYAKEGLEIGYLPGGPNVVPEGSLLTGKADIALTQMLTTAKAISQKGAALKIIGVQYQKSPLGIVSLESSNIRTPADLAGKTLAVPTLNAETIKAFLRIHGLEGKVKVVPYAFNPAPLINGDVDATIDFVTQVPFIIQQVSGKNASYFLLHDNGLPLSIDLVTVTTETLGNRRSDLVKFLRASRRGWAENLKDPLKYPVQYHETWFKGTGTTLEAENYFNSMQGKLMTSPNGFYSLTDETIEANIASLAQIGVPATKAMFDMTLLAEI